MPNKVKQKRRLRKAVKRREKEVEGLKVEQEKLRVERAFRNLLAKRGYFDE